tara:strand:+ start:448 stop:696 length:249 start_codon:yes stop_codon:yes gene_type:complete
MKSRAEREAKVLGLLRAYRDGKIIRYKGNRTSMDPWYKLDDSLGDLAASVEGYTTEDSNETAIRTQIAMLEAQLREYRGEIL